jgi:hypothetical protein
MCNTAQLSPIRTRQIHKQISRRYRVLRRYRVDGDRARALPVVAEWRLCEAIPGRRVLWTKLCRKGGRYIDERVDVPSSRRRSCSSNPPKTFLNSTLSTLTIKDLYKRFYKTITVKADSI